MVCGDNQEELFLSLGGSEEVANDGQRLLHVLWPQLLVHWGQVCTHLWHEY